MKDPKGGHKSIAGGSIDLATNTLYLSLRRANDTLGPYANPPVIVAFDIIDNP